MTPRRPPPAFWTRSALALLLGLLCSGCGRRGDSDLPGTLTNVLGMRLVRIPAGSYARGSPEHEAGRLANEGPVRRVRITRSFYLATTEVTNAQFRVFVESTGYRTDAERDAAGGFGIDFETAAVRQAPGITWRAPGFPGSDPQPDHPVVLVSWQDAEAFCQWLSKREARLYRLPTEAEWEYAARAGTTTAYPHGPKAGGLGRWANVADASMRDAVPAADWTEAWDDGFPFVAPVASFRPNDWGLHDMHGNVWEWCRDWFGSDYYAKAPADDPPGPATGRFRAIRGGGWFNAAPQNRSAQRVYFDPRFRYCLLSGFRVLLEAPGAGG